MNEDVGHVTSSRTDQGFALPKLNQVHVEYYIVPSLNQN